MTHANDRAVALWLLACCTLVFAIVVVGGVTRLTRSGLSIVEWQPIVGTLPPLSDRSWQQVFEKYRKTPEFKHVNPDMNLAGFKRIFWWEYFHRLLGRLIGAAFLVPFLWFALRRKIPRGLMWKLVRNIPARRAAGRARLVHGAIGPHRRAAGLAIPPHGPSGNCLPDLRVDAVDRSRSPFPACGGGPGSRPSAAARRRAGRSGLRDGALGGTRRGNPRGTGLQHFPAHERLRRPSGNARASNLGTSTSSATSRRCSSIIA